MKAVTALAAAVFAALILLAIATSASAAFPGDNGRIAYSDFARIFTVKPDGSGKTKIHGGYDPAWSPDGSLIAFMSARGGPYSVGVMRPDGSDVERLTPVLGPNGHNYGNPDWAPSGRRLAIQAFDPEGTSGSAIFVIRRDGSFVRQLARRFESAGYPQWSPDGRWVLFSGRGHLHKIHPTGRHRQRVDTGLPCCDGAGSWSPGGHRIVFVHYSDPGGEVGLYVLGRGGHSHQLTSMTSFQNGDATPEWSPNGKWIAFVRGDEGSGDLYKIHPDGTTSGSS